MARGTIFDWLDHVRARPGMYIGVERSLDVLETLVHGYYAALDTHGIIEHVPEMSHHFATWLRGETGWSMSCGWAVAIRSQQLESPFDELFRHVDRYRKLRPVTLATALVSPTRGVVDTPSRIEIVRYRPTQLHFLRSTHGTRTSNDWILMTPTGSHQTSLRFAKHRVMATLQAAGANWRWSAAKHE